MKKLLFPLLIVLLFIFSGCSLKNKQNEVNVYSTENPNAEEILSSNSDANIFQYNDVIYQTHIDWVDELDVTKGEQVGKIKTTNNTDSDFENEMANKLPVGTKIFSVQERTDILIVEHHGEQIKYLAIVEG